MILLKKQNLIEEERRLESREGVGRDRGFRNPERENALPGAVHKKFRCGKPIQKHTVVLDRRVKEKDRQPFLFHRIRASIPGGNVLASCDNKAVRFKGMAAIYILYKYDFLEQTLKIEFW